MAPARAPAFGVSARGAPHAPPRRAALCRPRRASVTTAALHFASRPSIAERRAAAPLQARTRTGAPLFAPRACLPLPDSSRSSPAPQSSLSTPRARDDAAAAAPCAPDGARSIEADKLGVRDGVQGGRGVVAQAPISASEVVARVPEEAALVVCFADSLPDSANDDFPFEQGEWVSPAYWRVADWDSKLAVLLLYHRSLGDSSPWADYVDSLPGPNVLWTAADLDQQAALDLQYTPMLDAVNVYRFRLATELNRFRAALPTHLRYAVSDEDFAWALKVVHSRAFSIPPGGFAASATRMGLRNAMQRGSRPQRGAEWPRKFALVPLLDMMNHGSGEALASFRFDAAQESFELVAGDGGYQPDSQVLVSYGDLTNDDLLLLYGFVQAGNPSDVYEVEEVQDWASDHPSNADWNLWQRKLTLLEGTGLLYEGRKFFISRNEVDEHLAAALRVLLASADELAVLAAATDNVALRNKNPPAAWYKTVSEKNERAVWATMERQCDRMLAEFPTSLDQDEEMIILLAAGSSESDVSVSAPLLFRVEKKRILRDAVELAAIKQLCIATNASKESERSLLQKMSDAKPPPPETWSRNLGMP